MKFKLPLSYLKKIKVLQELLGYFRIFEVIQNT